MEREAIFKIVVQHARDVLPSLAEHDFRPEDALKELGANSIDRSEISIMSLESLSLVTPLADLAPATNIGELVEILHGKLATP